MTESPTPRTPALARLLRWQDAGGTWQVLSLTSASASVALCRCDGGEEVERMTSADPELLAFLEAHPADDQQGTASP